MSNHEPSEPPQKGLPARRAYRPVLVAIVVTLAVVVGMVLKTTTRHHRIATNPPEQSTGQNVAPSAAE
jgi:Tfp pilus assembly protein PilX